MEISPLLRKFTIATSTYLAALSSGSIIAFPSVLLQQLQAKDTIVQLDLHKGSWIGSVHGIAGIPSILLPILMQYKGRRCAFILSCSLIITGWVLTYLAQGIVTLIIAECFHGLGTNSLLAISFLSISEMVEPKYRNLCLQLFGTVQAFGISSGGILGRFLHWKTVCLITCFPVLLALPIGFIWPESPSWLACKGKLRECETAFKKLRGTGEESNKELKALIESQKEILDEKSRNYNLNTFFQTVKCKDFYKPAFHTFILLNVLYWSGGMPIIIYATDMMQKSCGRINQEVKLTMDCMLFIGYSITSILLRYYSSKKVMLSSMCTASTFMMSAAIVTYLQSIGEVSKDSEIALYCLLAFITCMSLGGFSIGFALASEIMPVKHRGIGGCLYVILTCVFHSFSLKTYPYLSLYLGICTVFFIYAVYLLFSIWFIWKYVPDTKNRTLHEIENFYNNGDFKDVDVIEEAISEPFIKLEITTKNSNATKMLSN